MNIEIINSTDILFTSCVCKHMYIYIQLGSLQNFMDIYLHSPNNETLNKDLLRIKG